MEVIILKRESFTKNYFNTVPCPASNVHSSLRVVSSKHKGKKDYKCSYYV